MLDIKKVYCDTRFKTPDSKSDSDFFIELPRSLNVPDNVICYITDVVIPVSWSTIDARNNLLYMYIERGEEKIYKKIALAQMNYNGTTFSTALETTLNTALTSIVSFDVLYDLNDNLISIKQRDNFDVKAVIVSGADLLFGNFWSGPVSKSETHSLNGVLRIGKTSHEFQEGVPYVAYIDLHTTRNLYITSSKLASYNVISNFENDVIIKKIAVKANYSEMLFDTADAGYDFLDVSRRALSRIDFRLQDSFGNIVDLRNNHWSFSLVFQIHNN
jgi:hypothetical protein